MGRVNDDRTDPWCNRSVYRDGQVHNWLWFKITKPLVKPHFGLAPELNNMPASYLVVAIPTEKVVNLKEE